MEEMRIDWVPFDACPLTNNRYVVNIPEFKEIPQWFFRKISFEDENSLVMELVEDVNNKNFISQLNKTKKLKTIEISLLSPAADVVMKIVIENFKIKDITPCDLTYENDDFIVFKIIGKYKKKNFN